MNLTINGTTVTLSVGLTTLTRTLALNTWALVTLVVDGANSRLKVGASEITGTLDNFTNDFLALGACAAFRMAEFIRYPSNVIAADNTLIEAYTEDRYNLVSRATDADNGGSVAPVVPTPPPTNATGTFTNANITVANGIVTTASNGTGAGGGVTTVSVTTANGVSGSVATPTTTPAISLTLGAITPSSVNSVVFSGASTPTLAVTGTTTVSGSNTGDNAVNSLYSGLVSNATHTGDATGATALTVVGLRGVALPTLVTGNLRYNGTVFVFDATTYLTSNQTITLSGPITGTGTTTITTAIAANAITTTTIANNAVTLAKLATQASNTILGNNSGSTAVPSALTATQVTALLNIFTTALKGLVPASGGGTTNFLRADATWAAVASLSFTAISVNQTLVSGVNYLATVTGLTGTLPNTPTIGDVIGLSTGNFGFTVLHGNASQQIFNINNLTTASASNGIYLKPRSSVNLIYEGANIWVTQQRARTINNWVGSPTLPSAGNIVSYTPTNFNSFTQQYSTVPADINNGVSAPTGNLDDGLLANTDAQILITFASATILRSINLYVGQGNLGLGSNLAGQFGVDTLRIYGGNTLTTLIATISPTRANSNGVSQIFNVINSTAYTQYIFRFEDTGNQAGVMELVCYNASLTGGEVLAT
jgi:hypothetical protein